MSKSKEKLIEQAAQFKMEIDSLQKEFAERLNEVIEEYIAYNLEHKDELLREGVTINENGLSDNQERSIYEIKDGQIESEFLGRGVGGAISDISEKAPKVCRIIKEVVAVEQHEKDFVKIIKEGVKHSLPYQKETFHNILSMGVASVAAISSLVAFCEFVPSEMSEVTGSVLAILSYIGAYTAAAIGMTHATGAIDALGAIINYEKNVKLLQELGLYSYVQRLVEDYKKYSILRAEKEKLENEEEQKVIEKEERGLTL